MRAFRWILLAAAIGGQFVATMYLMRETRAYRAEVRSYPW